MKQHFLLLLTILILGSCKKGKNSYDSAIRIEIEPLSKPTSRFTNYNLTGSDCEIFLINEADLVNSYVEITKELNNFEEVWGTFQMSLKKASSCRANTFPEILTIEKGEFYIKRPKPKHYQYPTIKNP